PTTAGVQSTTTTDANGLYTFTGLTPGSYMVEFAMPTGYDRVSLQHQGADDTVDSDIDRTTRRTTITQLTSGENDPSWDAGFYQTAKIGNYVWEDTNGNGLQVAGELGVSSVTVNLLDGSGNPIDGDPVIGGVQPLTTSTDASGLYLFSNLDPG